MQDIAITVSASNLLRGGSAPQRMRQRQFCALSLCVWAITLVIFCLFWIKITPFPGTRPDVLQLSASVHRPAAAQSLDRVQKFVAPQRLPLYASKRTDESTSQGPINDSTPETSVPLSVLQLPSFHLAHVKFAVFTVSVSWAFWLGAKRWRHRRIMAVADAFDAFACDANVCEVRPQRTHDCLVAHGPIHSVVVVVLKCHLSS